MYGSFVALGIVSNIIFALMPPRAVEKSLAQVNDSTRRIRLSSTLSKYLSYFCLQTMKSFISETVLLTMKESRMLLAAPVFLYLGFTTCVTQAHFKFHKRVSSAFWMSIYAATLIYSKRLSNHDNLQAYYISAVGVGEILSGYLKKIKEITRVFSGSYRFPRFQAFSRFRKDDNAIDRFDLLFTRISAKKKCNLGTALFVLAMVLAFLSTPFDASHSPTDDETLLIQPRYAKKGMNRLPKVKI